ncbi:hypothetical protein CPB84DRAFT_1791429 [Gymnopilus junonius]|uniref:Uncharacterized protein n=1 Tax=Gymnopilus junonius TaxID=109634 RepID=A0A9P5NDZ1_GYMJU|nr:hypothetical protein CPB84DRAFT_1791429 [Gymnopilus junonius]
MASSIQDPKRVKLASTSVPNIHVPPPTVTSSALNTQATDSHQNEKAGDVIQEKKRTRIHKLMPPRPFPTVPTSVSATGPRSSHREGKNMICLTRKTSLGHYMRRCKDVIIVDGYKALHLSAMGAAIPLLTQLVCALPPILPFSPDEITTEITTGTVEVQDEVIPEDEDEDFTYQTRGKSVLRVIFKIGDGEFEGDRTAVRKYSAGKSVPKSFTRPPKNVGPKNAGKREQKDTKGKGKASKVPSEIIFEEPEQEFTDML